MATATEIARELYELRSEIARLKLKEGELVEALAAEMTEDKLEVEGLAVFERRYKKDRKQWDYEGVYRELRAAARNGEIARKETINSETGEIVEEDDIEFSFRVAAEAANPTFRVTYLRKVGIDPDEHCTAIRGGVAIQIHGDLEAEVV